MSLKAFEYAFHEVLGVEGGYSTDPKDPGNWTGGSPGRGELKGTKCGISAKAYPHLDIKNLTPENIKGIYYVDYWKALSLDEVPDQEVAKEIFDSAVNCGNGNAVKFVQRSCNFLGDKIKVDCTMGPLTLSHIKKWCDKDPRAFHKALNGFQFIHYNALVEAGAPYGYGWLKRIQSYRDGNT